MRPHHLVVAAALGALASPALAQMDHSTMPGMKMPAKPAPKKAAPKPRPAAKAKPVPKPRPAAKEPAQVSEPSQRAGGVQDPAPKPADPDCSPEHAQMGHCTPKAAAGSAAMPGMTMDATADTPSGTDLAPGDALAPAPPRADYADRIWGSGTMQPARDTLRREHGGGTFTQLMFNLAEVQVRQGRESLRWDGEFWYGGDINKLVIKTEGDATFGEGVEDAEIQALYSRTIGPYFNVQAGIRHDIRPRPSRTYATVGFEGLAPYWFEVEGALFLSDKGDVLGRLEGYYDQRITQRLILQPRVELNFSAQDVREIGLGSGLTDAELGLRLRYEVAREFAPYIGVSHDAKVGRTARFARVSGEEEASTSFVAGVRFWF